MPNLQPADELFSVYYQTEWRERGLTAPHRLPRRLRLLSLAEAVHRIAAALQNATTSDARLTARLAQAQLARHAHPASAEVDHAMATLVDGFIAIGAFGHQHGPDARQRVLTRLRSNRAGRVHGAESQRNERFFSAYANSLFDVGTHPIKNYSMSWSHRHRVTDVMVGVDVRRPLSDFKSCCDPRLWAVDLSDTWKDIAVLDVVPMDRNGQLARRKGPSPDQVPLSPFFEEAVWPSRAMQLTTYRNLLEVAIDLAPHPAVPPGTDPAVGAQIGFTYDQGECLTVDNVGGNQVFGGIDVDRGFARCRQVVRAQQVANGPQVAHSWCRLEARKRARFSKPTGPLNLVYNDIASVWLLVFIEYLVLSGTQL